MTYVNNAATLTKKYMAVINVHIYGSQDRYSRFVSTVGELTGRGVTHQHAHAGFSISHEGVFCHYDLRQDGVNMCPLPNPVRTFSFSVPPSVAATALRRVDWYRKKGYKVSFGSLVNALLYPKQPNMGLCTSFVDYCLTGEVGWESNRMDTFIKRYALHEVIHS